MKKVFTLSVSEGEDTICMPPKLRQLLCLKERDKFFFYENTENGFEYQLSLNEIADDTYHLIKTTVVQKNNDMLTVKITEECIAKLAWKKQIFAYYENGGCRLVQAKPNCTICQTIAADEAELCETKGMYLCEKCRSNINEVEADDSLTPLIKRDIQLDICKLLEKINKRLYLQPYQIRILIEKLEGEHEDLLKMHSGVEHCFLKLEEEYNVPSDFLELMRIYINALNYGYINHFYGLGTKVKKDKFK